MTKPKKYLPSVLYGTLLLIIAVLCIIIANSAPFESIVNNKNNQPILSNKDNENTAVVEDNKPKESTDVNNNPDVEIPDTNNPTDITQKIYNDTIPRESKTDNCYLYSQSIYGDKTTLLLDVFQTSVGIYVIAYSDSTNGDIYGSKPCVGIIKMDSYGNIISSLSLNSLYASTYITACPTALGLVVVTTTDNNDYYYISNISYDLSENSYIKINKALGGKIIPTQSKFLFFAEYEEESLIYSYNDDSFSFQSVGSGKIVEVFEYGTYYLIFSTNLQTNSYSMVKLSKDTLEVLSEINYSDSILLDIFPISENSTQKFIMIENRGGTVWAKKYLNSTFNTVENTKKIGKFDLQNAYVSVNNIILVCQGNIKGIINLSYSLETTINSDKEFIPTSILDSVYSFGTVFYIATDENKLALIYTSNDTTHRQYFNISTNKARVIINLDETFMMIYQDNDEIKIIGINK